MSSTSARGWFRAGMGGGELSVALLLVGFIFVIYVAAIAILWFFSFWSVSIISDAALLPASDSDGG